MIFYFSATGNSHWVAQRIAEATGDTLVPIAQALGGDCSYTLQGKERLGFVFPVHGWRVPRIVNDFIEKLQVNAEGHYCFVVVTAGDNIGLTIELTRKSLQKKGIVAHAAFSVVMPESYVGLRMLKLDTEVKERSKIQQADKVLNAIIDKVDDRRGGDYNLVKGNWPRTNSKLLGWAFQKWLVTDKPFKVDADKCTHCGLCAKQCPVGDIKLSAQGTPEWQHNELCLTCFACYHHCPVRAIDFGNTTKGVGQYYFKNK